MRLHRRRLLQLGASAASCAALPAAMAASTPSARPLESMTRDVRPVGRDEYLLRIDKARRLMIRDGWRSHPTLVLELMRAVVREVVERDYTHLLTAVFEDDPHSPYRFHTRVLGFQRIGSHRRGALACASRRILLVLDVARAWERFRSRRPRFASQLVRGLEGRLDAAALRPATRIPESEPTAV